jgi:hypothetical protein
LLGQAGVAPALRVVGTDELCRRWLDSDRALKYAGSG